MTNRFHIRYAIVSITAFLLGIYPATGMATPVMTDYVAAPSFLSTSIKPNVMVLLDTSTSMMKFAYDESSSSSYSSSRDYDPSKTYDGIFESAATYRYDSTDKYFYKSTSTSGSKGVDWFDGNFLNWTCMRRIDVAKQVLAGGQRDTVGTTKVIPGFIYPSATGWSDGFQQYRLSDYDGDGTNECYYHSRVDTSGTGAKAPYFERRGVSGSSCSSTSSATKYYIRAKVSDYPSGIIYDFNDIVRFGLAIYSPAGSADQGGRVLNPIGDTTANIVSSINTQKLLSDPTGNDTWTQMAESLYSIAGYFAQNTTTSSSNGPRYSSADYKTEAENAAWPDPYPLSSGDLSCVSSYVILVSDGEANHDDSIPASVTGGSDIGEICSSPNDCYLDDVAYWMHTTDLREGSFGLDVSGTQSLSLYAISTFGGGEAILKSAAKYGGFDDQDGDNQYDTGEDDEDSDGIPDNFFKADSVSELYDALTSSLLSIREQSAAASAVSVISTSSAGEGTVVQAFFRPVFPNKDLNEDVAWIGFIQSLWLDAMGNMREDANSNQQLDINIDNVITFTTDNKGNAVFNRYDVTSDPYPDTSSGCGTGCTADQEMATLKPLWEAGKILTDSEEAGTIGNRHIFTYIDKDDDSTVDDSSTQAPFDGSGEVIRFDYNYYATLKPYLGVKDNSGGDWDYLFSDAAVASPTDYYLRAVNLIYYIQGNDISWSSSNGWTGTTDLRSRLVEGNSASTTPRSVWILGDTVNSSPVCIATPPDNFGVIYGDSTYQDYYTKYKNREMAVYVGANDGMLHAFTSWKYNRTNAKFENPYTPYGPTDENVGSVNEVIGTELWAYIPQALLPHLKWLAKEDYQHVYYVDMPPRILDARIFTGDSDTSASSRHPGGWGTILIGGLNWGGKSIDATGDFDYNAGTADTTRTFKSCYFAIDITEPREPKLLWERTYDDLGFTTSVPAVFRVKKGSSTEKWFAVFGSGPTDYEGNSTNNGHIYIVDLLDGTPKNAGTGNDWLFDTGTANAFMGSPASLDYKLNYNVDAIYIPETSGSVGSWNGTMYKIEVPWWGSETYGTITSTPSEGQYEDDPLDATHPWQLHTLISSIGPITAAPSLSVDTFGDVWVYFGSGRYICDNDKADTSQNYFYGIKDPFFNIKYDGGIRYNSHKTLNVSDLLDVDGYTVTDSGNVWDGATSYSFYNFRDYIKNNNDGWVRSIGSSGSGERIVRKPTVLGGIVLATSFEPTSSLCGMGGNSYLYSFYYETGTAFTNPVFGITETFATDTTGDKVVDRVSLSKGLAASAGIHLGQKATARSLIQQSSGTITTIDVLPAFYIKSNITSWEIKK